MLQFPAVSARRNREPQSLVDKPSHQAHPGRETQVSFAEETIAGKELRNLRGQAQHWRLLATRIQDRHVLEAVAARLCRIETQIVQMEAEMCQNSPAPGLDRHANQPKSLSVPRSIGVESMQRCGVHYVPAAVALLSLAGRKPG
jgi:hypothetical protein